ncbi:MAG: hypothetical protein ACI4DK_13175 [Lachnospiraceae bacterium]
MKRIIKHVQNEKIYYPRADIYLVEKISLISGWMFFICYLLIYYVIGNKDIADIFLAFCLSSCFISCWHVFCKLREGYSIQEDGICFRYRFIKHKLLYEDIKCIIIVNSYGNNKIVKTPYIIVIGGEQNEILQYCNNFPFRHVLASINIMVKLGAEIGCYHPGNIWTIFNKGSSAISDYGFIWNKREMYKIFKGFRGDYHIAASVIESYRDKFDDIVKEYGISDNQIHIIDDSTDGEFLWW